MMGDTYVPRFWPPFLTLWVPNSIFFGCFFLIHQHKNDLLGTNPHEIRSFWPQNTIFPSIFLGPIFSGPRHTPSNFRTEYPPPGVGSIPCVTSYKLIWGYLKHNWTLDKMKCIMWLAGIPIIFQRPLTVPFITLIQAGKNWLPLGLCNETVK